MAVYGIVNEVAPAQIAGLASVVMVGTGFTDTFPVTLFEIQPFAFFTVNV